MNDYIEDVHRAEEAIENMNQAYGVIRFEGITLSDLPPIPQNCRRIEIDNCDINRIIRLPLSVLTLEISNSIIVTLELPSNLTRLLISSVEIDEVLNVPDTLESIQIEATNFPFGNTFPANLKTFIFRSCNYCDHIELPSPFPNSIEHIEIRDVPLITLPIIPLTERQHWDLYNLTLELEDNEDRDTEYDAILYDLNENGVDPNIIIPRLNAMRDPATPQNQTIPAWVPPSPPGTPIARILNGRPQNLTNPTWVPPSPPDTPVARALNFGLLTPSASPLPDPYPFYATPKEIPYTLAQFPMCFDIVMQEDVPIFDAISSGNIVFQVGGQYLSTSMIELKRHLDDPLQTRYACPTQKGLAVYKRDTDTYPYTMISLTGNFLVSRDHLMQQIAQSIAFVFELVDTGKTLPYTVAEANIMDGLNAGNVDLVSADHCQAGSERKVYGLQPLTFTFQRAQGGRKRNRKTYRKRKNQKRTTTKKIGRKL